MAFFEYLAELAVAFGFIWDAGTFFFALGLRWCKCPQSVGALIFAIRVKFLEIWTFEDNFEDSDHFLELAVILELEVTGSGSETSGLCILLVNDLENLLFDLFGSFANADHGCLLLIRHIFIN